MCIYFITLYEEISQFLIYVGFHLISIRACHFCKYMEATTSYGIFPTL